MTRRNVVLAVTGSIAAYKGAQLAGELVRAGAQVRVILTRGGSRFVSAITFEGITGQAVAQSAWSEHSGASRMEHLDLAAWADVLVLAPASADAIARLAQGRSSDLLSSTALAFRGALIVAPAMETNMFTHPATHSNLELLVQRGAEIVGPESGRLASGATGLGRMSEPPVIVAAVLAALERGSELAGLRVLVTAGPTHEPIDPVRYVGNRSSGKMGYAVAAEAARRGAAVLLVSGPTALNPPPGVARLDVETAEEMRSAVLAHVAGHDIVVMCAAVADYRPAAPAAEKMKRGDALSLRLLPTDDIAAAAVRAAPHALHVGFALESTDVVAGAREKLRRKGQTLVVANQISASHNPFGADSNQVVFVTEDGERSLPRAAKSEVATLLWDEIRRLLQQQGD